MREVAGEFVIPHRRDVSLVERVFNFAEVLGANLADLRFPVGRSGPHFSDHRLSYGFAGLVEQEMIRPMKTKPKRKKLSGASESHRIIADWPHW
jgi:hypothetical protein